MINDILERVRSALKVDGVTPAGLARSAGLHRNTLYGADKEEWNPTAGVLKALEEQVAAIEAGEWKAPPAEVEPTQAAA